MKTLTVIAYEWFDKINGNSYFAAIVYADNIEVTRLPFQYGYGDQYQYETIAALSKNGIFPDVKRYDSGCSQSLWGYCEDHNITLLCTKHENCKQRELKAIAKS